MDKKVLAAIIRILLKLTEKTDTDDNEFFDLSLVEDYSLLRQVLNNIEK